MKERHLLVALSAATVAVFVSVGVFIVLGRDGGTNANAAVDDWAQDVCTDVGQWQATIKVAIADVSDHVGELTAGDTTVLQRNVTRAGNATEQLLDQLRRVGLPDDPAVHTVTRSLEESARQILTSTAKITTRVAALALSNPIALVRNVAVIADEVTTTVARVQDTVDVLASHDVVGAVRTAIDHAPACQRLGL